MSEITCKVHYQSFDYKINKLGFSAAMKNRRQMFFHLFVCCWGLVLGCEIIYLVLRIILTRPDMIHGQYGLGIQYMTIWNLVLHFAYFAFSLKVDLMSSDPVQTEILERRLSVVFHSLVFPLAFSIALVFWGLVFIDQKLLDKFNMIDTLLQRSNSGMHTFIVPCVLLELFISNRPREVVTSWTVIRNLGAFFLAYCIVIAVLNYVGDEWPYPIFGMFNLFHFILFFGIALLFGFFSWSISCFIQDLLLFRPSQEVKEK